MTKIIMWVVVLGVLAGGGYFLSKGNSTKEVQSTTTETSSGTPEEATQKKMAFSSFLKNDQGSYQCTVKQYMDDFGSEGIVYVSAGKIRGEFTTVAEGKNLETSIIVDNGYQYVWSSAMQNGFKMKLPESTTTSTTGASTSGTYSWNAEQIGDYDCTPWTVEQSKFIPPSTIVFTDMSAMVPRPQ
jgi:hypothetical protein